MTMENEKDTTVENENDATAEEKKGKEITRRQALARMGGVGLGIGLASMSGFGRLAQAVAAESGGGYGVLSTGGCGPSTIYNCTHNYTCPSPYACENPNPHDCATGFTCPEGGSVSCDSSSGDQFYCYRTGVGDPAYECMDHIFNCQQWSGTGKFYCGDGSQSGDYEFRCIQDEAGGFHCEFGSEFACREKGGQWACHPETAWCSTYC
jgi:hypothetical protein